MNLLGHNFVANSRLAVNKEQLIFALTQDKLNRALNNWALVNEGEKMKRTKKWKKPNMLNCAHLK